MEGRCLWSLVLPHLPDDPGLSLTTQNFNSSTSETSQAGQKATLLDGAMLWFFLKSKPTPISGHPVTEVSLSVLWAPHPGPCMSLSL